jgi:DNA-binding response OmpR family regulator
MIRTLIISKDTSSRLELQATLAHESLSFSFTTESNGFRQAIDSEKPEILLLEINESLPRPETWELISKLKKERNLPLIALILRSALGKIDPNPDIDDFLVTPFDSKELFFRINLILGKRLDGSYEPIEGKDLIINPDTCEVMIQGNIVDLTFKEYELLKLLASNKGHVFTREALLDKIWGYDYFGGDRTVDVHVRRLRSKIEHSRAYIETVRNIGYRFIRED